MLIFGIPVSAQIGEHRSDFAIGFNGGYMMSSVGFTPSLYNDDNVSFRSLVKEDYYYIKANANYSSYEEKIARKRVELIAQGLSPAEARKQIEPLLIGG